MSTQTKSQATAEHLQRRSEVKETVVILSCQQGNIRLRKQPLGQKVRESSGSADKKTGVELFPSVSLLPPLFLPFQK